MQIMQIILNGAHFARSQKKAHGVTHLFGLQRAEPCFSKVEIYFVWKNAWFSEDVKLKKYWLYLC